MEILKFDTSKSLGKFKILNATNGGPWHKRHNLDQPRSNFSEYKAARIPYSRNHDSAVIGIYGGPYSHDISRIFPCFDADVNDPASYDFACTDEAILICMDAGTETFFRLGQTIEHHIKKHAINPPVNFQKWAEICEHIIMHYNEGWADGMHLNIQYWEIWNEPDLYANQPNKVSPTWGGTEAQFYDFYEIAAKHLKTKFPHLKIGGPAICGDVAWGERFLANMQKRNVPIDFFSWHIYTAHPEEVAEIAEKIDVLLKTYGYENAESILNEWNYVRNWNKDGFPYSIMAIHGLKNASFITAVMAVSQSAPVDMLMYYDTRPSAFCGIFDFYSYAPLKGYYPMKWYGNFYDMEYEIKSENHIENIYSLCGVDKYGKVLAMLTYYSEDDNVPNKEIVLDFCKTGNYNIYLLDENNDEVLIDTTDRLIFDLTVHSCLLIKEV